MKHFTFFIVALFAFGLATAEPAHARFKGHGFKSFGHKSFGHSGFRSRGFVRHRGFSRGFNRGFHKGFRGDRFKRFAFKRKGFRNRAFIGGGFGRGKFVGGFSTFHHSSKFHEPKVKTFVSKKPRFSTGKEASEHAFRKAQIAAASAGVTSYQAGVVNGKGEVSGIDCQAVTKQSTNEAGDAVTIGGTMCFDQHGRAYIVPGSRHVVESLDDYETQGEPTN